MTKIDIFSGFLGAGKTTLIKKLISEAYVGEKLVLIENEFGEIGIDGGFLRDAGIEITEMNSGCICCSLVGDFATALCKVLDELHPDRIIIEPSGVGKLSDVIKAVKGINRPDAELGSYTVVVDVNKCKMYMKNFGEFYNDQIKHASSIVLSHTGSTTDKKLSDCVALLREHNSTAVLITTPWEQIGGAEILAAIHTGARSVDTLTQEAEMEAHRHGHHEHEHADEHHGEHHHEHGEGCKCGCGGHGHHEHDHEHTDEHHGEHHHEHGEGCKCGCGGHGHHHHHADEVFASFGTETVKKFTAEKITEVLEAFAESDEYGMVLRAKGIVAAEDGKWIHFDYVPGEPDVRYGTPALIGALCVIGVGIDNEKIKELFGI
ncbi:MAG: GTP-binding protein [Clostridia bacterium]|nr:GTP-binding protein [Clostridia bacterium]